LLKFIDKQDTCFRLLLFSDTVTSLMAKEYLANTWRVLCHYFFSFIVTDCQNTAKEVKFAVEDRKFHTLTTRSNEHFCQAVLVHQISNSLLLHDIDNFFIIATGCAWYKYVYMYVCNYVCI